MPTIRLDSDVFEGLKSMAEPFTDTPNSVIRRLLEERGTLPKLEIDLRASPSPKPAMSITSRDDQARNRSKSSRLTPQSLYETYLLSLLATQFKGKGDKSEVTKAVIRLLKSRSVLGPADLVHVSTGETKAENTIAWGRNALKDKGLISQASPRGIWELTEQGMKEGLAIRL